MYIIGALSSEDTGGRKNVPMERTTMLQAGESVYGAHSSLVGWKYNNMSKTVFR